MDEVENIEVYTKSKKIQVKVNLDALIIIFLLFSIDIKATTVNFKRNIEANFEVYLSDCSSSIHQNIRDVKVFKRFHHHDTTVVPLLV